MAAVAPDLASLMAGMGGGGGPPPGPEGPPQGGSDTSALIQQVVDLIHQAMPGEPDAEDKVMLTNLLSLAQKYLAKQQADKDALLGGVASPRGLRKALG